MDILALAPGVRLALTALGFKPEEIVKLMSEIGAGINNVNTQLTEMRAEIAALKAGLASPITQEDENGRSDENDGSAVEIRTP